MNYSELSEGRRKSPLKQYIAFYELLAKISGSQDQTTQKIFLNSRFKAIHEKEEDFKELTPTPSWEVVFGNIISLAMKGGESISSNKLKEQLNNPNSRIHLKILRKMIVLVQAQKVESSWS